MTFVNTTAIAYTKIMRLRPIFCPYAITVVFTNVMRLRVGLLEWFFEGPVCMDGLNCILILEDTYCTPSIQISGAWQVQNISTDANCLPTTPPPT